MNWDMCIAEQSEYEGQFSKDIFGAYIGCHCHSCTAKREYWLSLPKKKIN